MHIKFFAPFLFILLIVGCSQSFFYNRLDTLINWYVDDFVELDREQQVNFDKNLNTVLSWHRNEELSRYIEFLDQIETDIEKPVDAKIVDDWTEQVLDALGRVDDKFIQLFITTTEDLSQEQVEALIMNLWEKQKENEEEYLSRSDEEYSNDSAERLSDNLGRFLGPLTDEQEDIIKSATRSFKRFDQAWLEERQQWYATLEQLLNREPGWQQQFNDAYKERDKIRTEKYHAYLDHNTEQIKLVIAKVVNARTDEQSRYLKREINKYKDEFKVIISEI